MTTNYIGHNKVLLSSFGEEGKDSCFQAGKIFFTSSKWFSSLTMNQKMSY